MAIQPNIEIINYNEAFIIPWLPENHIPPPKPSAPSNWKDRLIEQIIEKDNPLTFCQYIKSKLSLVK